MRNARQVTMELVYQKINHPSICLWGIFNEVLADSGPRYGYDDPEAIASVINDKGLVTYDCSVRKDAFYFYKALWNPEPMVYITSRRFTESKDARTEIKVYTNMDRVEFYLNGKKCGKAVPDGIGRASVPVTLSDGENIVRVVARKKNVICEDNCVWKLVR